MLSFFTYKRVSRINVILFVSLLASLIPALWTSYEVNHSNQNRIISLSLSHELAQSSADLTRTTRLFVVTGDPLWEKSYNDIVEIRSGKKARPDGRTVSLDDLFKAKGFTVKELPLFLKLMLR